MTDPVPAVEAVVKADVAKVETAVSAEVVKVKSWYSLVFHPWAIHAYAAVVGYITAHFGLVSVVVALAKKVL